MLYIDKKAQISTLVPVLFGATNDVIYASRAQAMHKGLDSSKGRNGVVQLLLGDLYTGNIQIVFSGSKERSIDDITGIGPMIGSIYREASSPEVATDLLRRAGVGELLDVLGVDLASVESDFIEYQKSQTDQNTGGVDWTNIDDNITRELKRIDFGDSAVLEFDPARLEGFALRDIRFVLISW